VTKDMDERNFSEHLLVKRANAYHKLVSSFFEKHIAIFKNKEQEMNQLLNIGVGEKKIQQDAALIKDCLEVIHRHMFHIEAKIISYLSAKDNSKVSLAAMDNSVKAWENLLQQFPELSDECFDILSQITSLRSEVEKEFPDAGKFIRVGFDTEKE
jgi:polyhydroxyalkanoate synthesis regulator protein